MLNSKNCGSLLPSALSAKFVLNLTTSELTSALTAVDVNFRLYNCGLPVNTKDLKELDYLLKYTPSSCEMEREDSSLYVSGLVIWKSEGRSRLGHS